MTEMYCTPEDVARAYGVRLGTVHSWCRKGVLEGAVHAGRLWRIPIKYATGTVSIELPEKDRDESDDRGEGKVSH